MEKENDNQLAIWEDVKSNQSALTKRLSSMIINGEKLPPNKVEALVAFAMTNDLNPFNGECYYLPNIGPIPGIAGWRKKAQEQLNWEAQQAGEPGAHYWVEYEKATTEEAKFDPNKDYAWKVTLQDWISNKKYRQSLYEALDKFSNVKDIDSPYHEAMKFIGHPPVWTGIGVVFSTENFGNDKMDRNERAKKRAEKIAIRKRFPRIELPDIDSEPEDVVTVRASLENPNQFVSVDTILEQVDPLDEMRKKIVDLGKEKGGAENEEVIKLFKEYAPKGNPNRIKDLNKLEELFNKLNEIKLPEVDSEQEKQEEPKETKEEEEIF
jgi:hypothetical protein